MAYDLKQTEAYIRQAAVERGIDPDTAVRVAKSEGLAPGVYQSKLGKGGTREPSFGPFQLLVGGEGTNYPAGMGNDFIAQTGLDPRDPSTVPQQVDFALDRAASGGWSPWYGAKAAGIGSRDGIGGNAAPQGTSTRELNMGSSQMAAGYPIGGLGGLGGMMQEEEVQPGIGGFLNSGNGGDLLQALGMSLMSSPSNNPFGGMTEILPGLQKQRMTQQQLDLERQDQLNTRAAMKAALMQGGFSEEQAAAYAVSPQAASVAIAGQERQTELGQVNRTKEYLRTNEPEIYAEVEAGLPITEGLKRAQMKRTLAARGGSTAQAANIAAREDAALAQGLTPGTPEYKSYVLTGTLPKAGRSGLTADDRKTIREADDSILSANEAEIALQRALELSPKAMEGWTAGTRAAVVNNLPDWLVTDDAAASAEATRKLDNTVASGALAQLRDTFGGNPTEGERKILMELQGASGEIESVRTDIYKRALAALERRRQFNRERAEELKNNTYYDATDPSVEQSAAGPEGALDLSTMTDEELEAYANGR